MLHSEANAADSGDSSLVLSYLVGIAAVWVRIFHVCAANNLAPPTIIFERTWLESVHRSSASNLTFKIRNKLLEGEI